MTSKYGPMDCPKCGHHTEEPALHWIRAVNNPYFFTPEHMEVECERCHYVERHYESE